MHGGMEFRSAGGALHVCRRGGAEVWSSEALEARSRRVDVEVRRYAARKLWRRAVGV